LDVRRADGDVKKIVGRDHKELAAAPAVSASATIGLLDDGRNGLNYAHVLTVECSLQRAPDQGLIAVVSDDFIFVRA
jgi:hypothetical protein